MKRRTAVKSIGASIVAGVAVSGTAAARYDGPEIVSVDSYTPRLEDPEIDDGEYVVEYGDDGTVEITGVTTVAASCYEAVVDDVSSTWFGDVVFVEPARTEELCYPAVTELVYEIELAYEETPDEIYVYVREE